MLAEHYPAAAVPDHQVRLQYVPHREWEPRSATGSPDLGAFERTPESEQ